MNETLLQQVKRKLNITWEDTDTNNRVSDIMNQATEEMLNILGVSSEDFDFSVGGVTNTLYLAYCLYLWNHCENEFEDNYREKILTARAKFEVEQYAKND